MSLQVWLPLNGNLDNQGLSSITVTNSGATINNAGKIGSCYSFDGNTSYIQSNTTYLNNNSINFSIACWFKPDINMSSTGCLFSNRTASLASGISIFYLTNNSLYFDAGERWTINNSNIVKGAWNHLVFVKKGAEKQYYLNGTFISSTEYTTALSTANSSTFTIGRCQSTNNTITGNPLNGCLNDVRLYDHALSAQEVKKLAQGLVLHYPLNNNGFGQKNYLKNSNFFEGIDQSAGFRPNTNTTLTKQADCLQVIGTSVVSGFFTNNYDDIAVDTMTTFSAYIKADSNMTIYIGVDGTGINDCQSYTVGTSWKRISISKAKTTNNPYLRIYGNGTFYVKLMKYELGSIATNWCPNPADILASSIPYNNIVYDISGYKHHATVVGSLNAITITTPRYNSILEHLDSCADYMFTDALTFLETFTFACWVRCTNFTRTSNGTSAANAQFIVSQGRDYRSDDTQSYGANLRMYNGVPQWLCGDSVLSTSVQVPLNTWCHIVGTYDGTTKKIYLNGILKNSATDTNVNWDNNNSNKLVIGKMAHAALTSNIAYHPFVGDISDVRIYTTALSADDIAELYLLGCI